MFVGCLLRLNEINSKLFEFFDRFALRSAEMVLSVLGAVCIAPPSALPSPLPWNPNPLDTVLVS